MRFLRDALLTLVFLVFVIAAAAYGFARSGGLSARRQPGQLEYALATPLRNVSASAQAGDVRNPFANNPDVWREAATHYAQRCAMCHNVNGKGQTVIGSNLSPPPPDMMLSATQKLSDEQLFAIIRDGVRFTGMPAWREMHSDEEIWQFVVFVRHLPNLSLAEIDLLNPAVTHEEEPPVATSGDSPEPEQALSRWEDCDAYSYGRARRGIDSCCVRPHHCRAEHAETASAGGPGAVIHRQGKGRHGDQGRLRLLHQTGLQLLSAGCRQVSMPQQCEDANRRVR